MDEYTIYLCKTYNLFLVHVEATESPMLENTVAFFNHMAYTLYIFIPGTLIYQSECSQTTAQNTLEFNKKVTQVS